MFVVWSDCGGKEERREHDNIGSVLTQTPPWPGEEGSLFASLVAQRLKLLPAMRETWVQFLGREDPLEKEMATHASILTWRIPWTEEPGGLQSTGSQKIGCD